MRSTIDYHSELVINLFGYLFGQNKGYFDRVLYGKRYGVDAVEVGGTSKVRSVELPHVVTHDRPLCFAHFNGVYAKAQLLSTPPFSNLQKDIRLLRERQVWGMVEGFMGVESLGNWTVKTPTLLDYEIVQE